MLAQIAQAAADLSSAVDANHLEAGAVAAIVTSEIIEVIKRSGIKALAWVNQDSEAINRILGGLAAFATGLGLSFHYDHTTGTLIINGLLASSLTHAAIQWTQQQVYYRLVIAKNAPAPVPGPPPNQP